MQQAFGSIPKGVVRRRGQPFDVEGQEPHRPKVHRSWRAVLFSSPYCDRHACEIVWERYMMCLARRGLLLVLLVCLLAVTAPASAGRERVLSFPDQATR